MKHKRRNGDAALSACLVLLDATLTAARQGLEIERYYLAAVQALEAKPVSNPDEPGTEFEAKRRATFEKLAKFEDVIDTRAAFLDQIERHAEQLPNASPADLERIHQAYPPAPGLG